MTGQRRPESLSIGYSREFAGNADCRRLVPLLAELGLTRYQGFVGAQPATIA